MKKYLFLTLFLLWTVNLYAAPDSNMTIPSVGDGDTISASEHTTARNTISSTYNAHSHTDITSLSNLSSIGTITTGTWNGTDVAVTAGGTGSSTASGARTNLGLAIGTDIQGIDTQITDIAGLTPTDNGVIIGNGSNFVVEEGATLKTSLGLTIGTNVQAYDAQLDDLADGLLSVSAGGTNSANGWTTTSACVVTMSADLDNCADNANTTITFNTEALDIGNDFNTGTYTFTAPVTGYYLVNCMLTIHETVAGKEYNLVVTANSVGYYEPIVVVGTGTTSISYSRIFSLSATQTVLIALWPNATGASATDVTSGVAYSVLSIHRI